MTTWDSIIGHEWAIEVLQVAIRYERVGHAYLFTGPVHIGKTTLARTFAQALNCTAEPPLERPCGRCRACTLIAADRHPDVSLVSGEMSGRGIAILKIDQIRQLQSQLNLTATEARTKIAILKQFQTANLNAANAFLKTLEEPPNNVVLLLTAADADTLLPTITSRCRTIALRPQPASLIEDALSDRWQMPSEEARLLAHLADGRLGWAVMAAQDPAILETRRAHLGSLIESFRQRRVGRFAQAESLCRQPDQLPLLLETWLALWRDMAILANGGFEAAITNLDQLALLQELSQAWSSQAILGSLKMTELSLTYLKQNANARLVMENLLLGYPSLPAV